MSAGRHDTFRERWSFFNPSANWHCFTLMSALIDDSYSPRSFNPLSVSSALPGLECVKETAVLIISEIRDAWRLRVFM